MERKLASGINFNMIQSYTGSEVNLLLLSFLEEHKMKPMVEPARETKCTSYFGHQIDLMGQCKKERQQS